MRVIPPGLPPVRRKARERVVNVVTVVGLAAGWLVMLYRIGHLH